VKSENISQQAKLSWGYSESFFVAFEIVIFGFIAEIFLKGRSVKTPQFSLNLYIALALMGTLAFIHFRYRHKALVKWLSSIPCSVSAISIYALLVLFLGFIPQQEEQAGWLQITGLSHLKNSWPFLFIQVYLLVPLGLVILRRGIPFKMKNLGFLLNHAGLWIILVAAGLGSGDLKRITMDLYEGQDFNNNGILTGQNRYAMPFDMKLLDFDISLYNPKIAVADGYTGEIMQKHGETLPAISSGFETTLIDWGIRVKDYMPFAVKTDSGYKPSDGPGSMAVAYVETVSRLSGDTVSGWVASGSPMFEPKSLNLSGSKLLILTEPEPQKFRSLLVLKDGRSIADTIKLEVNRPYRYRGWKLYQIGYDQALGKYSTLSVIEAVKDPWLPLVYTGIIMMLAGAVYIFWLGRGIRSE
jgi:hypothetical protein